MTSAVLQQFPLASKLTELDKAMFGMMFNKYDADRNGYLNKAEFREYFKEIRQSMSGIHSEDSYAFELIDKDHNKKVTLEEFLEFQAAIYEIQRTKDVTGYYRIIFDVCDIGHKGYLVDREMKKFMKYSGFKTSLFRNDLKVNDLNNDGKVDWEELCILIEGETEGTNKKLAEYLEKHSGKEQPEN